MASRIAFGTDMGLLGPTALSLYSALKTTPSITHVHLLDISLAPAAIDLLRRISDTFECHFEHHPLGSDSFSRAVEKKRHVPKTALARMYLPRLVEGRVLYMDGDTLVRRDLRPLLATDMEGMPIGAVRDFAVLRRAFRMTRNKPWPERAEVEAIVAPDPVEGYFNSGVLLMDTDAIRCSGDLADSMLAFERAGRYAMVDQDYMNELFHGRVHHLNPAWNSSWGRNALQSRWVRTLIPGASDGKAEKAGILHFHGPHKPWKPFNRAMMKRGLAATLIYKQAMRSFLARYPQAAF